MSLRPRLIAALAAGLLLAGCSSPAPEAQEDTAETTAPAPAAEGGDLGLPAQTIGADTDCSLYSNDEIGALWGVPIVDNDIVTVTETGGLGGISSGCIYNQSDDGTGLSIGIYYREFDTEQGAIEDIATYRSGAEFDGEGGQEIEEAPGLGDEALYSFKSELVGTPQNLSESLFVRNGRLVLQISITDIINGVPAGYRDLLADTYRVRF